MRGYCVTDGFATIEVKVASIKYITMKAKEFITEKTDYTLPTLNKHRSNVITQLVKDQKQKSAINQKAWQSLDEEISSDLQQEVNKFVDWSCEKLHIENPPEIELSMDTEEAQTNHHTGGHTPGSGKIWVYANNRNLVDILRTTFHELVHVRQHELDMIKPGSSYPGSPIEAMADMLAGKYIKIYGEENNHIFE